MAERLDEIAHFTTQQNQPLIGIILGERGREVVYYFAEEAQADAVINRQTIQEVLGLAGAWSDLHWDLVEEELRRIRHESHPTPPISL